MVDKQFECEHCKKTFSSDYNLGKHKDKKTPCYAVLQCDRCKKIFNNEQEFV